MPKIHLPVISFLMLTMAAVSPAMAFSQKGTAKLPGASLSKNTSGVLREVCHDQLVYVTYGSRGGSAAIQLLENGKPMACENGSLSVRKQYAVPSTLLNKSDSGVMRLFEVSGQTIALFSTKNGASTLVQLVK